MEQQKLNLFEERPILSITQIVEKVKSQLEEGFHGIWVRGEISNLGTPPSGHLYFTLKDSKSQLKTVCFKMRNRLLKFRPEDGMEVVARGSLSVYAPRGDFQLVVESMEPVGPGDLQRQFEELKIQLKSKGLFDKTHKKKLPLLPTKVGVVTSPSGAAIQDILRVLSRRNNQLNILIFPAQVQGATAVRQITEGITYLNGRNDIDVIIVTRGGGSLEDLQAFNEESVAQTIFESHVPIISAVGHEIDSTISDFVADEIAPTPSAAAEIVSGAQTDLSDRVEGLILRCSQAFRLHINHKRQQLQKLTSNRALIDPESNLRFLQQHLDDLHTRLLQTLPNKLPSLREGIVRQKNDLSRQIQLYLQSQKQSYDFQINRLEAFSPQAVLERGYAITTSDKNQIIRNPNQLKKGDKLNVQVAQGKFRAQKI